MLRFYRRGKLAIDVRILQDMVSICYDGMMANFDFCRKATNTLDKQVFRRLGDVFQLYCETIWDMIEKHKSPNTTHHQAASALSGSVGDAYWQSQQMPLAQQPQRLIQVNQYVARQLEKLLQQVNTKSLMKALTKPLSQLKVQLDNAQRQRLAAQRENLTTVVS
ncbi:hypothetical protein [Marinomonas sp. TW1]|uniref:hypothetical protein n=1 Tax=Marinomonas sp. TW1 TaxID=1561203 RepID=UPI0007AF5B2A|nr:hypothetical protein [Marinomonas sp. TW1]KZN13579.1 hypothetical protein OA79_09385 [Marinomonas sp. TW1]